jgi:peptide/nickel transport system permease protein
MKNLFGKNSPWRQPLALIGVCLLTFWILVAIFAPLLAPHSPLTQESTILVPPNHAHIFGTDQVGRDILSRVIYGARVTLPLSILLVILSMGVGSVIGALAGYFGGAIDSILMRFTDMVLAFPGIILAMAVAAALGPQLRNAVILTTVLAFNFIGDTLRDVLDPRTAKALRD